MDFSKNQKGELIHVRDEVSDSGYIEKTWESDVILNNDNARTIFSSNSEKPSIPNMFGFFFI